MPLAAVRAFSQNYSSRKWIYTYIELSNFAVERNESFYILPRYKYFTLLNKPGLLTLSDLIRFASKFPS